jgi:hypothetical protein
MFNGHDFISLNPVFNSYKESIIITGICINDISALFFIFVEIRIEITDAEEKVISDRDPGFFCKYKPGSQGERCS